MRNNNYMEIRRQEEIMSRYKFWCDNLVIRQNKDEFSLPINSLNIKLALKYHPKFANRRFEKSTFSGDEMLDGKRITDATHRQICDQLVQIFAISINLSLVRQGISAACDENEINELTNYFDALPDTTTKHLDNWLIKFTGAEDTKLNRILGRKWLIAAAARAVKPGSYSEGMLIMLGRQGCGKSLIMRELCPKLEWYCDTQVDLSDERAVAETYRTKFIIEMGELDVLRKSKNSATKSDITKISYRYRSAYQATYTEIQPQWIYCGSTNDETYLTDTGTERRFWSVRVGDTIDTAGIAAARDAIWREALDAYRAGERWTLTREEIAALDEINAHHKVENPHQETIVEYINSDKPEKITSNYLMRTVLRGEMKSYQQLSNIMRELGYVQARWREDGDTIQTRGYIRQGAK